MTGMTQNEKDKAAKCGNCAHYLKQPLVPVGECWECPPQMIPVMQHGQPGLMPVRPQTPEEFVCGRHVWRPIAIKEKEGFETLGKEERKAVVSILSGQSETKKP